ncbi:SDR family NAD(P)-dependent oxidoreductase [Gulosibacter molinativorax]|nr:SDR family NAD(P)-dependent oxidoreductase [Gulosibacter molinativorax]QUY62890.1 Short-chain dehydrogenase [Gulosibacter molinativorax]
MNHALSVPHSTKKTVFITGGASGIGLATATKLAAQGCRIALVDRAGDEVALAAQRLGAEHIGIEADVTSIESLESAAAKVMTEFGRIDAIVANAGIGSASTVRASSSEQLLRIIDVNLAGQIRTVKATLEYVIASRGYITFTCSAAVLKHTPKSSVYAAAKAGIDAFAGALRLEVLHHGVDVGVFYPGWTKTPMLQGPASRAETSKGLPWPFNITNSVDDVADAYAGSILRRARTTYVPRIYRLFHALRPIHTGSNWDRRQRASAAENVRAWEVDLDTRNENQLNGAQQ